MSTKTTAKIVSKSAMIEHTYKVLPKYFNANGMVLVYETVNF